MKDKTSIILVTGANGQLGSELKSIAYDYPGYQFIFTTKENLPIENFTAVTNFFNLNEIAICINCAAFTAVDKAETETDKAFSVNADAVGHLSKTCKEHNIKLIHISTDYVFDGKASEPYTETADTCPINVYGASKLKGEELALQNNPATIIIRTSWVYSQFGNNFVKTMLRVMKEKEMINVVNDQIGCPTSAADLAKVIILIIDRLSTSDYQFDGVFNYSNSGIITWFDFALAIKEFTGSQCIINPVPTSQYPTLAKRPQYSVLDTKKIREDFQVSIPKWKDSLQKCLQLLK